MAASGDDFATTWWMDRFGRHMERHPGFWIRAGNLESAILKDELATIRIEAPIYIAGLARSGSTILLEFLADHPDTVTHRYKDYPPVFTPYWWNRFLGFMPKKEQKPAERAHKDGISITPDSPEAFEEVLWMAFFSHLHDPQKSAVLGRATANPAFERFYRDHIRKLLGVRGGRRYLSKGNYNLTRFAYLQKLFPDARFVLPIRDPAWHVASLIKQHRLFEDGERRNPEALDHMRRVGHFEFGLDRRPINAGGERALAAVLDLFARGKEVEGQARYWAYLHGRVLDQLAADPTLRAAVLVVAYEELCQHPEATIARLFAHARLALDPETLARHAARVQAPTYYRPDFSDAERALIEEITAPVAARFRAMARGEAERAAG